MKIHKAVIVATPDGSMTIADVPALGSVPVIWAWQTWEGGRNLLAWEHRAEMERLHAEGVKVLRAAP